jgi:hypothetical protein
MSIISEAKGNLLEQFRHAIRNAKGEATIILNAQFEEAGILITYSKPVLKKVILSWKIKRRDIRVNPAYKKEAEIDGRTYYSFVAQIYENGNISVVKN